MRIFYELLKIAIGVVAGAALVLFLNIDFHLYGNMPQDEKSIPMSYADLAAINLTVATIVLGAVALIVAIVAIFGFQVIRQESVSNAEARVKAELPKMLGRALPKVLDNTLPETLKVELSRMEKDGRLTDAMERAIYSGGYDDKDYEEGDADALAGSPQK